MIRIRYFAQLREQVGVEEELLNILPEVATLADLLLRLRRRGGVWADALPEKGSLMMAVNQELARPTSPVQDGDEVGFFPPVTGG